MTNMLSEAIGSTKALLSQEMFEAVAVSGTSRGKIVVRRPGSIAEEGPYSCLGAPPAPGTVVSVIRVGLRYVCLSHKAHIQSVRAIFADYTAIPSDTIIIADATGSDVRVTLSNTYVDGQTVTVKRVLDGSANSVFVEAQESTVDDAAEFEMAGEGGAVTVVKTSSGWYIVGVYP